MNCNGIHSCCSSIDSAAGTWPVWAVAGAGAGEPQEHDDMELSNIISEHGTGSRMAGAVAGAGAGEPQEHDAMEPSVQGTGSRSCHGTRSSSGRLRPGDSQEPPACRVFRGPCMLIQRSAPRPGIVWSTSPGPSTISRTLNSSCKVMNRRSLFETSELPFPSNPSSRLVFKTSGLLPLPPTRPTGVDSVAKPVPPPTRPIGADSVGQMYPRLTTWLRGPWESPWGSLWQSRWER